MKFLLGVWISLVISSDCPRYICKPSHFHFTEGTCVAYLDGDYYVSDCKQGICSPSYGTQNSTCSGQARSTSLSNFPGTQCTSSSDCYSGYCFKGICKGSELSQACSSNYDCDPGLYCKANFCAKLIPAGTNGCLSDFDCENSSGCDSGWCVEYFSRKAGVYVGSCPSSNKNLVCATATCAKTNEENLCIEALMNSNKEPHYCALGGNNCISKADPHTGIVMVSECVCGLGKSGYAFCGLFPGDSENVRMIKKLKEWIKGDKVKNCNTMTRFDESCMKTWWEDDFYEFMYYYWTSQYYPIIGDYDPCVLKVYLPDFYSILPSNDDSSSSSGSSYSKIYSIATLLFLFQIIL